MVGSTMHRAIAVSLAGCLLCSALVLVTACKSSEPSESARTSPLSLELVAFDAVVAPRRDRPFIAGETVHLAVSVRGGRPPYDVQVVTKSGDPRLAAASVTVDAPSQEQTTAGLELTLGSEVASGAYALTLRMSDQDGRSASISSEEFQVVGSDAPVHPPAVAPLHARVVDVAGRARRTFFQGEAIAIRATLTVPQDIAIAIVADDERAFMPTQRYPAGEINISIPLIVPRLARVGSYRVDLATSAEQASVPLHIAGTSFSQAESPVVTDLVMYGGPKQRIPQTALLTRGEALRIEAVVGGIETQATARLRVRTRVGKLVASHDFPPIAPADTDAAARSLLSGTWTPDLRLARGRHMLELEVEESGSVSTLYREVVLQ